MKRELLDKIKILQRKLESMVAAKNPAVDEEMQRLKEAMGRQVMAVFEDSSQFEIEITDGPVENFLIISDVSIKNVFSSARLSSKRLPPTHLSLQILEKI